MGSGSSAGNKRYAAQPANNATEPADSSAQPVGRGSSKSSSNPPNVVHQSSLSVQATWSLNSSGDEVGPRASDDGKSWHRSNCADTDMGQATCVRDAFDFDDNRKKDISKRERIWSVSNGHRQNYGNVSVSRLYPSKVHCSVCSTFIVDRAGEVPCFYFCWRCRRAGRSFVVCASCHEGAAHHAGMEVSPRVSERDGSRHGSDPPLAGRRPSLGPVQPAPLPLGGRRQSLGPTARRPSVISSASASKPGLSPSIPSGTWTGEMKERGIRRTASRKLSFYEGGGVAGSGNDGNQGCTVGGSFKSNNNQFEVSWAEQYEWGRLDVAAALKVMPTGSAQLSGTFTASDGGKGQINLCST